MPDADAMSHAALLEAIRMRDEQTALQILATDARICAEGDDPSAFLHALYNGLPSVAQAVAARRPLLTVFEAAAAGDITSLERALTEHHDAPTSFAADGFTALHLACFFGRTHAAALLLQARADPSARAGNATLVCPLHSAAVGGDLQICRMLLHAGADPNAVQQGSYTALHAACLRGNTALVELLLGSGADATAVADDGRTAASIARTAGYEQLAIRLETHCG